MTVTLRPAESRDCNAAAHVLQRPIREVRGPDYGNDNALLEDSRANTTPDEVIAWISDPSLETLVAERDGEVVGVGQLLAGASCRDRNSARADYLSEWVSSNLIESSRLNLSESSRLNLSE
jgi:hypothetical protein